MCAICVLNVWNTCPIWCVTHVGHVGTTHKLKRCDKGPCSSDCIIMLQQKMCDKCVLNMWHIWPIWCVTHVVHVRTSHMLKRCDIVCQYEYMFVWLYSPVRAVDVCNMCCKCVAYMSHLMCHTCGPCTNISHVEEMWYSLAIWVHVRLIV